jgi:hypothetical protein
VGEGRGEERGLTVVGEVEAAVDPDAVFGWGDGLLGVDGPVAGEGGF